MRLERCGDNLIRHATRYPIRHLYCQLVYVQIRKMLEYKYENGISVMVLVLYQLNNIAIENVCSNQNNKKYCFSGFYMSTS